MNYLTPTSRYTCGFLPPDTEYRTKQGLMQQDVANDCRYGNKVERYGNDKHAYVPPLYPLTNLSVNYGIASPADDCPCLKYIQPR